MQLHRLLHRSAERYPDRIAVEDTQGHLTYSELEDRSNKMASLLLELGVQRGDRVGLYLDKSIEAVISIYASLKCGAAYVPLDPSAPSVRLAYIARDCDLRVLITSGEKARDLADWLGFGAPLEKIVVANGAVDTSYIAGDLPFWTNSDVDRQDDFIPSASDDDLDLAYILYTSGSTGTPKGVMLSHRNAFAFVGWGIDRFGILPQDRLSSLAPFHFDLSIFDLFAAAGAGAAVVLIPPELAVFPIRVKEFMAEKRLTVTYAVPSLLSMLTVRGDLRQGDLPELRKVLFAGEVFPTRFLRSLMASLPHVSFFNLYGPTETNVCTCFQVGPIPDAQTEPVPIGEAIHGVEVFGITEQGAIARPGEVGELYVRGPTVMVGYWGDEERTGQSLVPDPRGTGFDTPAYRTGDLVRQDLDGNYRLLGRRDHQIKSRGYRIELGDIESALFAHPAVAECAVIALPDPLVTNRIIAFVVASEPVTQNQLGRFCSERIPRYMIPERIELVESLPKTSTGKVDRQVLQSVGTRDKTTVRSFR